jgi:hypothetical protein
MPVTPRHDTRRLLEPTLLTEMSERTTQGHLFSCQVTDKNRPGSPLTCAGLFRGVYQDDGDCQCAVGGWGPAGHAVCRWTGQRAQRRNRPVRGDDRRGARAAGGVVTVVFHRGRPDGDRPPPRHAGSPRAAGRAGTTIGGVPSRRRGAGRPQHCPAGLSGPSHHPRLSRGAGRSAATGRCRACR